VERDTVSTRWRFCGSGSRSFSVGRRELDLWEWAKQWAQGLRDG